MKKELSNKYEIIEINEDVFNTVSWREEISKYFWLDISAVFHVGACSNTLETNVNYIMLVNYEFTKHLSDLCLTNNVPMIYSSSAANYGTNGEYPSNLYGWSKYVGEGYVVSNGGIGLRYFNVYGPGEENKGIMASVAYQMNMKKENHEGIYLFPKKPTRDFVYVKDVVSELLGNHPLIHLTSPFAYPEFLWLMNNARLILTDSGGVQEEAPSLGKPVLLLRDTTERPEALEAGTVLKVGSRLFISTNKRKFQYTFDKQC